MSIRVRSLAPDGVEAFSDYLDRLEREPTLTPPFELLEDPLATRDVDTACIVDPGTVLASKLELGRSLAKVARQLDLTYDLHGMKADQILSLLPAEFERFKDASGPVGNDPAPAAPTGP